MSKKSTKESPIQIVLDHSPPHPETINILKIPNECRDEVNENPNDTSIGESGTSGSKDETVPKKFHPKTTLVPHKSTWFIGFVEHLRKE